MRAGIWAVERDEESRETNNVFFVVFFYASGSSWTLYCVYGVAAQRRKCTELSHNSMEVGGTDT